MKLDVLPQERVFLILDGVPSVYLGPGRHNVWTLFREVRVERVSTVGLLADLDPVRLALVPESELQVLHVPIGVRARVTRRGKPALWLGTGVHQLWTVEQALDRKTGVKTPLISVDLLDVSGIDARPLDDEWKALAPAKDYVEVTAPEGSVALRFVDGVLDQTLPAGRHAAFTAIKKVNFAVLDLKERLIHVTGQDVMTKDRVTLRLNVSAAFTVSDPTRLATVARNPDEVLYLAMQLAAREAVTRRTLDELLGAREELARELAAGVANRAKTVGLELKELGLKDVVLPGEMKDLLNKVIQAQKEAEANVIARREETAATRSMAQTAKVLSENPLLLRLKELEAYKELAAKVGQVHLVLGEGALQKLELKT